jgi:hypothetical protein
LKRILCALGSLLFTACGDDDARPAASSCGTETEPEIVVLRDVTPALQSTVSNSSIAHQFTVVGIEGIFEIDMVLSAEHSAGAPVPEQIQITPRIAGTDVTYEFSPLEWSVVPGHVVIHDNAIYQTNSGCFYAFPKPLFEYDIEP